MALGGTDLNLLLPLKALLEEGNVTRAGQRLNLSQPAMSATLARLRRRFDDELLVRAGREYELTPFARDLLTETQQAVRLVALALDLEDEFDPSTANRTFRLVMSDYAIAVIHEPLVRMVEADAPNVRLVIGNLSAGAHESERLLVDHDAVLAPMGFGFQGASRPLWTDRMVVLADRRNSRLVDGALTLEDLKALPYAAGNFGAGVLTPVDRIFGELRIDRRPVLTVFGFLPLPFVIEGTDMFAVVPEKLARLHARRDGPLVMVEPPFGEVLLAEGYWYAEHRLADPAYRWIFGRLEAACAELSTV
ncbi:transcriptional regulator, LysR family [Jatrophihabitans endophyticus]|uniref:Transcriptional regulator, LysR family n=1 Tax=Jatrophihabitans endophyticus TaxID=1206085 RepID=A0A1M5RQA2_9ACTN|nr:LysR family transcriptional regulator [Jatrophihabitans endophyticus]SHH28311.1 transcriptional regulator, LysR family [Jatrophihabitans endophyticus]